MRTTDGKPLITSRVVGEGEVVFFATSLDETWGRMMSGGSLAGPMNMYILAHLTARKVPGRYPQGRRRPEMGAAPAGIGLRTDQAAAAQRQVDREDPAAGETRAAKPENDQLVISTADTLREAEYAIVPIGAVDPAGLVSENGIAFAVNPDLRDRTTRGDQRWRPGEDARFPPDDHSGRRRNGIRRPRPPHPRRVDRMGSDGSAIPACGRSDVGVVLRPGVVSGEPRPQGRWVSSKVQSP